MEFIDQILNDIEKAEIHNFNANKTMQDAVRKVLLAGVYFNGTLRPGEKADASRNFAISMGIRALNAEPPATDEELGQDLRASIKAMRLVENAMTELAKCVPVDKPAPKTGPSKHR
jgi:hypothetical protein